jgi:hypothetical protein
LNDFPNIRSTAAGGAKPFEIFGITQKSDTARHLPMTFNKIFYKGQLELNPKLKQELIDYIDYINLDKTGTGGKAVGIAQANALEHNRYYTKGVKEILNGLVSQQKKPVISSIVGEKKWNAFAKKTAGNFSTGYTDKIKYLEKLAGYEPGTHTNQMRRLRDGANKMFGFDKSFQLQIKGVKKVKDWLPSYDHLVNISFAAQSKNPVIAKTALDNISIVPAGDNLWVKGFGFDVNSDKWFNSKVYEYENALPGEKLSKLEELKNMSKDMGIKIKVEGGKVIPSPIEDLAKKPLTKKMESYASDLLKKNPNIINDPDFQLLPEDFREMIIKYKRGDPDFLGKFKPKLEELEKLIKTAKTAKGPGKLKALGTLITLGGAGFVTALGFNPKEVKSAEAEASETGVVDKAASWPIEHPWLTGGAATGASKLTKADPLKYFRKVPRKILSSFGTPTGALAAWPLAAMGVEKMTGEETPAFDIKSTGDRIGAEAELALAPTLVKWTDKLTKPIKNPAVRAKVTQLLNLGMKPAMAMKVARVASPIGIGSLIVEASVKSAKDTMAAAKQIDAIQDQDLQQQEYDNLIRNIVGHAGGGMVGIRKPSALPPTGGPMSQGLRSLYINDRDY